MNYYFNAEATYELKLNSIFLCGCKYNSVDFDDKRKALKCFIENQYKDRSTRVIILEECCNFLLNKSRRDGVLYYNDVELLNLFEIELLASLYANKIYILHETISTAAELGLFAGCQILRPKICLIVPEQSWKKVMPTFIRWAFYMEGACLLEQPIKFKAKLKGDKTYFPPLSASDSADFVNNLNSNLSKIRNPLYTGISKPKYNRFSDTSQNNVEYILTDKLEFHIGVDALKVQLLSMFLKKEIKTELRKAKRLINHVNYLKTQYAQLLFDAVKSVEGENCKNIPPRYFIKGIDNCDLPKAIGFFLFWLKATNLIDFKPTSDNANCSFTIKCDLLHLDQNELSNIIVEGPTEFGKKFGKK